LQDSLQGGRGSSSEENSPLARNRKGNSDKQPSTPPAAERRAVLNLPVKWRALGTNNCIEDTGCLVKSPRLKPHLSDPFSAASENHGKSGAKF